MPQQTLLQKLDEALARVRLLEREKDEAITRSRSLEHDAKELRGLIALAESKAEEILKPASATSVTSVPEDSKFTTAGKGLQDLVEEGAIRNQGDLKRRYP